MIIHEERNHKTKRDCELFFNSSKLAYVFEEMKIKILRRFKTSGTHRYNRCDLFEKLSSLAICALYGSFYFSSNFFYHTFFYFFFLSHFDHFFTMWAYLFSVLSSLSLSYTQPSTVYILFRFYVCHSNDQISDLLMSLLCSARVSAVRFRCNTMRLSREFVLWHAQDFYQTTSMKCTAFAHHIDRYVIDSHS